MKHSNLQSGLTVAYDALRRSRFLATTSDLVLLPSPGQGLGGGDLCSPSGGGFWRPCRRPCPGGCSGGRRLSCCSSDWRPGTMLIQALLVKSSFLKKSTIRLSSVEFLFKRSKVF